MTCTSCMAATMRARLAGKERPYRYTLSGLQNVLLCGITVYRCPSCHVESPSIPAVGRLHRVIADSLARKTERLSGEEIRFLRKNIGVSATELASGLGIAVSTISRAEHDKRRLPLAAEGLLRDMARDAAGSETARERILELSKLRTAVRRQAKQAAQVRRFRLIKGGHWEEAA